MRVVRLMRERGLGNSVGQLHKKLTEQHTEVWLQRVALYLTHCEPYSNATLVVPSVFQMPPERIQLPRPGWFFNVYVRDVLQRLPEVRAKLTSTLGRILKIDSTKKVYTHIYIY